MAKFDPPAFGTQNQAKVPAPGTGNAYVVAGPPRNRLVVTTSASGGVDGVALTTQPVITITDRFGNTVTGDSATVVSVDVFLGDCLVAAGGTATASSGVATFSGLILNRYCTDATTGAGSSLLTQLRYTAHNCYPVVDTVQTDLLYGAATKSSIRVAPVGAASGDALETQPVINILDAQGVLVANSTVNVVAAKATGTGTLSGTTTKAAVAGVATFTDLVMTTAGDYTLSFTPTSLTACTSGTLTTS